MSVFGCKADIAQIFENVRLWPKADIEHTAWQVAIANAPSGGVGIVLARLKAKCEAH
jgi:hypothetical protein